MGLRGLEPQPSPQCEGSPLDVIMKLIKSHGAL